MGKIFSFVGIALIAIFIFASCTTVKDFYFDNKEVIKEVVEIILDTIFTNITPPTVNTPSGDSSGMKIQSAIPVPSNTATNEYYRNAISHVVNSPDFWRTVDEKVGKVLEKKGLK